MRQFHIIIGTIPLSLFIILQYLLQPVRLNNYICPFQDSEVTNTGMQLRNAVHNPLRMQSNQVQPKAK